MSRRSAPSSREAPRPRAARPTRRTRGIAALVALGLALGAAAAAPSAPGTPAPGPPASGAAASGAPGDPFAPGPRWARDATAAAPWIPSSVAWSAAGGLAWASAAHGQAHLFLVETAGDGSTRFEEHGVAGAEVVLAVTAGEDPRMLFAVAQYAAPDLWHRRVEVTRHDAVSAAGGDPFAPRWSYDPGLSVNGAARLACDGAGERAALAVHDPAAGTVTLDLLDGTSGTRTARLVVPAPSLGALAVSADGARVALVTGTELRVVGADGLVRALVPLAGTTRALALSRDGDAIAVGDGSGLRLLARQGATWASVATRAGGPGEICARAAIAADGSAVAAGFWNATTATALRFELCAAPTLTPLVSVARQGPAGGYQAFPEAVAVSADGRRAAFGSWGDGASPAELWIVDRDRPTPVLHAALPGSVRALALDPAGTRALVAYKHGHANVAGSTGGIALYDTGEADVALLAPLRVGGELALAARRPGATAALFVLGTRAARPTPLAGATGLLGIDRGARLVLLPAAVDATGRAEARLAWPADRRLLGLELAVQAVFSESGRLSTSATVLDVVGL